MSSTSTRGEDLGELAERDGAAAELLGQRDGAGVGAVGHDDVADARRDQRPAEALRDVAGAEDQHRAAAQREHRLLGERDRGRRDRQRRAADRGLGADALADLDRVAEDPGERLTRRALRLGLLPRAADLAEDLALAEDHRVEPGGDAEEVAHRAVVVVRVEVLGERPRAARRPARRGSRGRPRPRSGTSWSGRRSRCGCRWRAARPRRGARATTRSCSALSRRDDGHRDPLAHLHRRSPVVQTHDDHRHERSNSLASASRPARIRSRMPESKARRQSASSLERPEDRIASRASLSSSSRVAYSVPISSRRGP